MVSADIPRMRMFAGPNGSGKSTIKSVLQPDWLGVYVNPDDIQLELAATGVLDLAAFKVDATQSELLRFVSEIGLLPESQERELRKTSTLSGNVLTVPVTLVDAYLASVLAAFIRRALLAKRMSFTFETVMSSPDKIALLDAASACGFRRYLYYIATEDPAINISRVESRVHLGGHPVAPEKIRSRYVRSLGLLYDAIRKTDRAYVFDNSGSTPVWLAEITNGTDLELKVEAIPGWFQESVLRKLPH